LRNSFKKTPTQKRRAWGRVWPHVIPIEPHAEEATEFFIICEHDLSTFDKLLNNALDFIGYDSIVRISNLGKASLWLCFYMTDVNKHTVCNKAVQF
jgi:hypothetical protein